MVLTLYIAMIKPLVFYLVILFQIALFLRPTYQCANLHRDCVGPFFTSAAFTCYVIFLIIHLLISLIPRKVQWLIQANNWNEET